MALPEPPVFPGLGAQRGGDDRLTPIDQTAFAWLMAGLGCVAAARFQGDDLAGIASVDMHVHGPTPHRRAFEVVLSFWPAPQHGRARSPSGDAAAVAAAIADHLGWERFVQRAIVPLRPDPMDGDDHGSMACITYALPLALSQHQRLAARAWLATALPERFAHAPHPTLDG